MKWGKQKASSTTTNTSHPSLISHIFPSSWLSKFKQSKNSSEHRLAKAKKKGHLEFPSLVSSPGFRLREGRFYGGDDDSFWRLSFGDEQAGAAIIGGDSVWRDLYKDNEMSGPISHFRSCGSEDMKMAGIEESRKSCGMVSNFRQKRIMQPKAGFALENYALRRKKVKEGAVSKTRRRKTVKVQNFDRLGPKTWEEKNAGIEAHEEEEKRSRAAEKVIFEVQPGRMIYTGEDFCQSRASNLQKQLSFSFQDSKLRTIEEDHTLEANHEPEEEMSLLLKMLNDIKITQTNSKSEQHRRSVYINRDLQRKRRKLRGRIKSYSPRIAPKTECKIKALEDMKKAKMMKKKKNERGPADTTTERAVRNTTKEKAFGDITTFESYAVIKNSLNPRQDFRESMIEMIVEKGIERPEELEELLACYLTLNYDEYHDLIVKVFREVWLELNELYLASNLQNDCSEDY